MSILRGEMERLRNLENERKNLLLEIEGLKKMAESKTGALESEVGMLREEVKSLRILLGVEAADPPETEPEKTSPRERQSPVSTNKPDLEKLPEHTHTFGADEPAIEEPQEQEKKKHKRAPELLELVEKLRKKGFTYPDKAMKGFLEAKIMGGKTREQAIKEIEEECL